MSRIGKVPVEVPEKVEIKIEGAKVSVKGPKGSLSFTFTNFVKVEKKDKQLVVTPNDESPSAKAQWGTTRTVLNNMVVGVTQGFTKVLEFNGVGYKAATKGKQIVLNLGYSHPIEFDLPQGIEAKVDKNQITVSGCDKELVGYTAAKIRSFRSPEPYKGKGVKYIDEKIIRKAGKTGAKK